MSLTLLIRVHLNKSRGSQRRRYAPPGRPQKTMVCPTRRQRPTTTRGQRLKRFIRQPAKLGGRQITDKGLAALRAVQEDARRKGLDKLSKREINIAVAWARRELKKT